MIIIKMNWISILQNYDLLNRRVQISVKFKPLPNKDSSKIKKYAIPLQKRGKQKTVL